MTYRILILGPVRLPLRHQALDGGHSVTLVCTRATADLIEREGTRVRFPVKGRETPLEVASKTLPGELFARTPTRSTARLRSGRARHAEAQYGSRGVRELMRRIARARKPCLAIMNMPPLPYLKRIAGIATKPLELCYADPPCGKASTPPW